MSSDNEIAIVKYNGKYYVDIIFGGNYHCAIKGGHEFSILDRAEDYAYSLEGTEYGICYYEM